MPSSSQSSSSSSSSSSSESKAQSSRNVPVGQAHQATAKGPKKQQRKASQKPAAVSKNAQTRTRAAQYVRSTHEEKADLRQQKAGKDVEVDSLCIQESIAPSARFLDEDFFNPQPNVHHSNRIVQDFTQHPVVSGGADFSSQQPLRYAAGAIRRPRSKQTFLVARRIDTNTEQDKKYGALVAKIQACDQNEQTVLEPDVPDGVHTLTRGSPPKNASRNKVASALGVRRDTDGQIMNRTVLGAGYLFDSKQYAEEQASMFKLMGGNKGGSALQSSKSGVLTIGRVHSGLVQQYKKQQRRTTVQQKLQVFGSNPSSSTMGGGSPHRMLQNGDTFTGKLKDAPVVTNRIRMPAQAVDLALAVKITRTRLKQNKKQDPPIQGVEDLGTIDFSEKPNFLVSQAKSRAQSGSHRKQRRNPSAAPTTSALTAGTSQAAQSKLAGVTTRAVQRPTTSIGRNRNLLEYQNANRTVVAAAPPEIQRNLLLRETSQQRILEHHTKYLQVWQDQEIQREERVASYLAGKELEPKQAWMSGLAGLDGKRSKRVKSSTGSHFGTLQKESILNNADSYNQVKTAREVVAVSRHMDRDDISQPPKIWYDSLRSNAKEVEISIDASSMLSKQGDNTPHQIQLKGKLLGKKNLSSATFSIPLRKQQRDFIPRGSSALLGYSSQHRDLGMAKPLFKGRKEEKSSRNDKAAVTLNKKSSQSPYRLQSASTQTGVSTLLRKAKRGQQKARPQTSMAGTRGSMDAARLKANSSLKEGVDEPNMLSMLEFSNLESLQKLHVQGVSQFKREVKQTRNLEKSRQVCHMDKLSQSVGGFLIDNNLVVSASGNQQSFGQVPTMVVAEETLIEHCSPRQLF